MAATVTIRAEAFSDPRITLLGKLLGCSSDEALARIARLWSVCAAQQTDRPEVHRIRGCLLDVKGEVLLIQSGLGQETPGDPALDDGGIRVRGCDKTDWYYALIEQQGQVDAGKARAATAERDRAGRFLPVQPEPASDLCPDLGSSSPDLLRPELPDLGAAVRAETGKALAAAESPSSAGLHTDLRRKLHKDSWAYAGLKHAELKRSGIDADARNCWSGHAAGEPALDLFARIDELTLEGMQIGMDLGPTFAIAGEVIRNRIDVAVAIARRDQTLRWFIPARMWAAKSFAIDRDLTPAQAGQPRQPPPSPRNPGANDAPRKLPTR